LSRSSPEPWLKFCLVPGIGDGTIRKLLDHFGSIEAAAAAPAPSLRQILAPKLTEAVQAGPDPELLLQTLSWLEKPDHFLVSLGDADYPALLREIADPPPILYGMGRRDLLNRPSLAIVGSRSATPQGEQNAEAFAEALANAGLTIVSGLALGIDASAHRGGLKGTGSTIAVVGTGLDRVYPARNKALAQKIARSGLLLSEFNLRSPSMAGHFPKRNRIISGLARGVLVAEATPDSGSLITARLALEQGREVFAIPGSIHSPQSRGCNMLIKHGAKLVETANDVLEELAWPVMPSVAGPDQHHGDSLLQIMGHDPVSLESLANLTGLTVAALSAKLLALELEGRVAQLPGGRYQQLT
jgi:DNA processing protein